ncbi:hypothetical protein LTR37_017273 [Vermiconidia calcicola]|uniref:Uncharacterized protein n=1 Tax=Vermiconidia calcicola TaxID=1690605 RepID=A0ACC3MN88_9PEZI|nr:hypothetical protein LTR37_017273 [Vermiconidia calcicola]
MGASRRTPLAKFDDIPGELPEGSVPSGTDLNAVAQSAILKLNNLQEDNLTSNAIWRDLLSLTGYYRTIYPAPAVSRTFTKLSKQKKRSVFRLKEEIPPQLAKSGKETSWVDINVLFTAQHENLAENCWGIVSVIPDANGHWKIWMLRTWLECFDGYGHPDLLDPVGSSTNGERLGTTNGASTNGKTNGASNGATRSDSGEYGAIVVGGGQAGLSTAGRLQALGIEYVLLEKHAEIGSQWVGRYESLKWHTSKEYGNLPFGHTFPAEDEYMLPTKRIGAGHKAWAEKYGINVRTSTTVEEATWDQASRKWTIVASSPNGKATMRAKNLVLAIGTGHSTPIYPEWASTERVKSSSFKGTLMHSFAAYKSAHRWAGKRGIVVGTANTGHDIAEDMANAGMDTTIVQRNPTFVFPAEWLHAAEDVHYHADMHPELADKETFTYPNKIMRELINRAVWAGIKASPERFDALERAGFKVDRFGDTYNNLYVRFGGHYVDIGASARIAKGEIKVKSEPVKGLTEHGLLFEDGKEVGADLIVLCTGFDHDFRNDAVRLVGRDAADQMDDFWGVDKEGELRGHAKPAGHSPENRRWFGSTFKLSHNRDSILAETATAA